MKITNNGKVPDRLVGGTLDHAARFEVQILLDRGWGKPTQPIGGDPDSPIIVEIMGRRDGRQLYRSL